MRNLQLSAGDLNAALAVTHAAADAGERLVVHCSAGSG